MWYLEGLRKSHCFYAPYAICHPNNLELRPMEYFEAIVDILAEPALSMSLQIVIEGDE